ncbi:hypothetical protein VPH35_125427 [Triticum aestivum]
MLCNLSTYPIICIMTDCDQGLHSMKKAPIYMFISDIVLCLLYYFCTLFVELVLLFTIAENLFQLACPYVALFQMELVESSCSFFMPTNIVVASNACTEGALETTCLGLS